MLQLRSSRSEVFRSRDARSIPAVDRALDGGDLKAMLGERPLRHRVLRAREYVFRAGQPRRSLFLINSGFFKICVASADGREKVAGFRMKDDVLGLDSLGMEVFACDAVALDVGEIWELPYVRLCTSVPQFEHCITSLLAKEVRRDWSWMLTLATFSADQKVAFFLLDLADRMSTQGFSRECMRLRMTRADLGSFLALKLETVTRTLARLQEQGMISVRGREITLHDAPALAALLQGAAFPGSAHLNDPVVS
jgi:CRP/FNR family transcriptional regulator